MLALLLSFSMPTNDLIKYFSDNYAVLQWCLTEYKQIRIIMLNIYNLFLPLQVLTISKTNM